MRWEVESANAPASPQRIFSALEDNPCLFGALIVAVPDCVAAQETPSIPSATLRGIRHILYLTIKSDDPDLRVLQPRIGEPDAATLTVKIRIADHSQETKFFGDVPARCPILIRLKARATRKFGKMPNAITSLPKMTIMSVDGHVTTGQQKLTIPDGIPGNPQALLGAEILGPGIFLHNQWKRH